MKYMKLGSEPDTFYTEEAVRSVLTDIPTDLIIHVGNTKYLLHKFPLLLKCGLLQRLCSEAGEDLDHPISAAIHDVPGGEAAFELCAKFCYGIAINLSAHNFMLAFSAARFLQMTESVASGNLVMKLEMFFESCILQGWKDSIVTLQSTKKVSGWLDDHRILQSCVDSIVEKILTDPSKVTWSYTYSRPGYTKKDHRSVPKDWWTEDVAELDLEHFCLIITAVRSTKKLLPALIGEALHVYACKHLPEPSEAHLPAQSSAARTEETMSKHRRVLESIVSMIPAKQGSVSGRFLLRLLKIANYVGASASTKAELVRRSGRQLDEATASDLLIPSASNPQSYDFSLVAAILENFVAHFRRQMPPEEAQRMTGAMTRVAKIHDSYLQVIAHDAHLSVTKFIDLAESLPEMARQEHDGLYQAIDTYLKEHPDLSKAERKQLCRLIDCRKLSHEARSHAIANDQLPLRTVVQILFVEQERAGGGGSNQGITPATPSDASRAPDGATRLRQGLEGGPQQIREPREGGRTVMMERSLSEPKKTKKGKEKTEEKGDR